MKYLLGILFFTFTLSVFADELVVYPEYPAQIKRDYAYAVEVTQGDVTKPLVVYNHTESSILSGRQHGGDSQRRFCEFAFSGSPVRVDVAVQQDVASYTVFPASARLKTTFKKNVISVYLDRPVYFGIRLNDDANTILSVFPDAPETDVPQKDAPGVMYVDSWTDAPDRSGVITTDASVKEIYIAPGAVLNAWLEVKGPGTKIHGRGMILDSMSDIFRYDQQKRTTLGLLRILAPDVTVDGIKLVDARTFNYIVSGKKCKMRNFKALSSMMCTDGISFFCGDDPEMLAENGWLYVGDNALVLSGSSYVHVRNVTLGTSCAAIFPQANFNGPAFLENINVFRCDEGLINNYYNGTTPGTKEQKVFVDIQNLSAVDCVLFPWIFQGRNMGTLEKTLNFRNISVPQTTGAALYQSVGKEGKAILFSNGEKYLFTNHYELNFTNLFIGGKPVSELNAEKVAGPDSGKITFQTDLKSEFQLPLRENRTEMNYVHPYKVFIGAAPQAFRTLPVTKNGKIYLCAKEIQEKLGLSDAFPQKRVSLEALRKITPISYDREAGKIVFENIPSGKNLVAECWPNQSIFQRVPSYRAKLETYKEADGTLVYSLSKVQPESGMHTIITDEFLKNGNGTYVLTFSAKTVAPAELVVKLLSNESSLRDAVELTSDWKEYRFEFATNFDLNVTRLVSLFFASKNEAENIQVKNIVLKKNDK